MYCYNILVFKTFKNDNNLNYKVIKKSGLMKNIKLIILFWLTSSNFANSQLALHVGGGLNYSKLEVPIIESNYSSDYFLNIRPEFSFSEKLKLSVDLQYSRKGFLAQNTMSGGFFPQASEFTILDFIPQLEYRFIYQLGIYTGIGAGVNVYEKTKINEVWQKATNRFVDKVDLGLIVGARWNILGKFFVHGHFASSLNNLSSIEYTNQNGDPIVQTKTAFRNFQLGVSYRLL